MAPVSYLFFLYTNLVKTSFIRIISQKIDTSHCLISLTSKLSKLSWFYFTVIQLFYVNISLVFTKPCLLSKFNRLLPSIGACYKFNYLWTKYENTFFFLLYILFFIMLDPRWVLCCGQSTHDYWKSRSKGACTFRGRSRGRFEEAGEQELWVRWVSSRHHICLYFVAHLLFSAALCIAHSHQSVRVRKSVPKPQGQY